MRVEAVDLVDDGHGREGGVVSGGEQVPRRLDLAPLRCPEGQGVEHDDMNVLVLGSRVIGTELSKDLCITFINARFTNEERHRRRLEKIHSIEQRYSLDSATKEKIS